MDPLTCQIFSGKMKIIHVIEDEEIIEKTVDDFGIWKVKGRPPPRAKGAPIPQNTALILHLLALCFGKVALSLHLHLYRSIYFSTLNSELLRLFCFKKGYDLRC